MKTPEFWYKNNSILKNLLYPFTAVWLLGNCIRKYINKPKKFSIPIICVGNIIAGGSGKTPLTIELAKLFIKKKFKVHVIKKQYKSANKKLVVLVNETSDPHIVGDEPILISRITTTWLVKNRKDGIEKAIIEGASLIILDDGYQDYSIIKDFNILTVNQMQQFGNRNIIPAGPLREKVVSGIQKADNLFFYGTKKSLDLSIKKSKKPVTFVKIKYDKNILTKIKNQDVLAFSGIAHPDNFFSAVSDFGINLKKKVRFSDHHRYTKTDLEKIIFLSKKLKSLVITTEKDYVKIPGYFFQMPI